MRLADATVRALKAPEQHGKKIDHYDDGLPRFVIRISSSGVRSFFLFTGSKKQRRRHNIGQFPIISLAQTREKAKNILAGLTLNGPGTPSDTTFKDARRTFGEQRLPKLKERTQNDSARVLDKHLAKLHGLKLTVTQFETVSRIIDKLTKTPRE